MRIGFIGLGAMGLPMAGHLVAAGHDVTVASRGRGPIDAAVAQGASDGGSPRGVAEASEVVILCVPNSPEVVEVVDAMLPALGPGKTVVDCSTIDPEVERAQHARVEDTGAHYLDAPLSGGTAGADKGTLTLMVGGDAAVLAVTEPALDPFAGLVVHVGGPGMGQVVKLCNQLIYAAQMTATAEATAMAVTSGVDMDKLLEVLTHATGDCVAVRTAPAGARGRSREPGLQRVAARLHDRPHGQGPRPGHGLRRPSRRVRGHDGGGAPAPDGGAAPPATGGRTSPPWPRSSWRWPAPNDRTGAAAHARTAPGGRPPGAGGGDDGELGRVLRRAWRGRCRPATASWPRPQPLTVLAAAGHITALHRTYLSINRTGLAGSAFELDDRLMASVPRAAADGWTGVKHMTRIDMDDPLTAPALELLGQVLEQARAGGPGGA